jgi:hypothetical protein
MKTPIPKCRLFRCFCLGWCSNFVGFEFGQKQSAFSTDTRNLIDVDVSVSLGMAAMRTCERQAASTLVSSTPAGTNDLSNKNNLTLLKDRL